MGSEDVKVETEIEKNKEQEPQKKIKTRVVIVLGFVVLLAIFAYISYRGSYLETIEIGENFKQVFTRKFKIFIYYYYCKLFYFIYSYIIY